MAGPFKKAPFRMLQSVAQYMVNTGLPDAPGIGQAMGLITQDWIAANGTSVKG